MSFTPKSAKNAMVNLGGVAMPSKSWTVMPETDEIDVTHGEAGGFYVCIGGITKAGVSIDFDFDSTNSTLMNGYIITPGSTLATSNLYLNTRAGPSWVFPSLFIRNIPNQMNIKEAIKGTLAATGSGSFTFPSGSF